MRDRVVSYQSELAEVHDRAQLLIRELSAARGGKGGGGGDGDGDGDGKVEVQIAGGVLNEQPNDELRDARERIDSLLSSKAALIALPYCTYPTDHAPIHTLDDSFTA